MRRTCSSNGYSSKYFTKGDANVLVTIASCGAGKCVWCQTTGEGVQASFRDGLAGFVCRRDFWAALKARSKKKETSNAADTAATGRKA